MGALTAMETGTMQDAGLQPSTIFHLQNNSKAQKDHKPHCLNYTSTIFTHLVKPASYRKSYFHVHGMN